MPKPNPKLEQYKRILRPFLEATGEVFCARLDVEVGALLQDDKHRSDIIVGLRLAIDLIRSEYRV